MEKTYEWIKQSFYRISAKAIIRDSKWNILLAQEDTGLWDFPGGWIDHWEEIHEALIREIKEEMGLKVTQYANQPTYVWITESSGIWSPKRPICLLMYEVEVENLDFTPSEECINIGFYSFEEAKNIDLYHPNIKIMTEILKQEAA